MILTQHGNNHPRQEMVTIGGRSYPVTRIGSYVWMAENLDMTFTGLVVGYTGDITTTTDPLAWYYDNDETTYGYSAMKLGLLYNWFAVDYMQTNRATLFPGWHVPSQAELNEIVTVYGSMPGSLRMPVSGAPLWTGTDSSGFHGRPGGQRYGANFFSGPTAAAPYLGLSAITEVVGDSTKNVYLSLYYDTRAVTLYGSDKHIGRSVRLVKD